MYTHTKTQDATACSCISFCQKIDLLWTKQCMCVCVCGVVCLSWGTLIRSTLTANRDGAPQPQTSGTHKMTVDEEKRKCSFIHSLPTSVYTWVCACLHSCQCVFRHTVCMYVSGSVFAVWIQLTGWCVKSLTASLWLVHTGRQHHPGEGEKRTATWDRPGLLLGRPMSVQQLVEGGWG